MFDPRDRDQVSWALAADDEITQLAVDVGGVLSGEHGIGEQKRKWMTRMFGLAELRLMHDTKKLLDPRGILNPGKVLPDEGAQHRPPPLNLPTGDFNTAARELAWQIEGVLTPPHEVEFANLLALATWEEVQVEIRGRGTASTPAQEGAAAVSTQALDHLTEHDHTNMTVTAGAGIPMSRLQQIVATEDQMVPLFPPETEGATLGGVVAADDQGPRGLGYGRCRDVVTGLTVALSTGEVVSFGSKCVKDVAGYDVKKLFIGSRAALGAIVELTVRTIPVPELRQNLVFLSGDHEAVANAAADMLAAPLRITALEAVDGTALLEVCESSELKRLGRAKWALAIETAGIREDVEETAERVRELSAQADLHESEELEPNAADELWQAIGSLRGGVPPEERAATVGVEPAAAVRVAARAGELAAACGLMVLRRASPASGIVRLRVQTPGNQDQLADFLADLAEIAPSVPGSLRTVGLPLRGLEDPSVRLSRQIKDIFDPAGVLPPVPEVAL